VDLEDLRVKDDQPDFEPGDLAVATPAPSEPQYPPQPIWQEPEAPRGLASALGGKKRHEAQVIHARSEFERDYNNWHAHCSNMHAAFQNAVAEHQHDEEQRTLALTAAHNQYEAECRQRAEEAAQQNTELDRLINELAFDMAWAIHEYVEIVLSQSVYPDCFPVEHDHRFDLETRELVVTVRVPEPSTVPSIKEYRYVKAKDEIAAPSLAVRDQKERYASAVGQVALRTLHEIFEADRIGRIHSVSLTVDTQTLDAATGNLVTVPLVVVAADRATFASFELANVVPAATLAHLGAAVSKNPFDLVPADTARGVRARGR